MIFFTVQVVHFSSYCDLDIFIMLIYLGLFVSIHVVIYFVSIFLFCCSYLSCAYFVYCYVWICTYDCLLLKACLLKENQDTTKKKIFNVMAFSVHCTGDMKTLKFFQMCTNNDLKIVWRKPKNVQMTRFL